jgi:hypothetical protein
MRPLNRFLLLPSLRRPARALAEPDPRGPDRRLPDLARGALRHARALVRRYLRPLRRLFGPRATDPEIHVIAVASSATSGAAGAAAGSEAAAHDERRRHGPRHLIVRLLSAAPTFAPQTT